MNFNTERLVEQVRHRAADGVVLEELRLVLRLKRPLLQGVGDDRENRSSHGQLACDAEPGKYAGVDRGPTKGHTPPFSRPRADVLEEPG